MWIRMGILTSGSRDGPLKLASTYFTKSKLSPIILPLCSKEGTYRRTRVEVGKVEQLVCLLGYKFIFIVQIILIYISDGNYEHTHNSD